jgi:hypothetical protein
MPERRFPPPWSLSRLRLAKVCPRHAPADKKPLADAARDANIKIIKGEERCAPRYFV